ncbi:plasmid pRiA4b ORF-3 family protein [Bradyrhizobium sp. WSM2793]|uniref:plasmid pRiA4b ORF-3 family protein n=1 Tax=Bradyrhizobium sp. WSM2793 TaxID=1038866 RepID=UPI001FDAB5BA|nr:plasmid pRiA4b ORF-3 family protein [Bradyrhizobium sp. WSM2793]
MVRHHDDRGTSLLLEDVGGAPGYAEYLDASGDPTHLEHENMRLWARTVRSQRRRLEDARGRRQRIVQNLEAAASRHAAQIDVKR